MTALVISKEEPMQVLLSHLQQVSSLQISYKKPFILLCIEQNFSCLSNQVYGIIQDTALPYYMPSHSMCVVNGVNCPIKSGSIYTDRFSVQVQPYYPEVSFNYNV